MDDDISFDVAWRGYDSAQVNELVEVISHALHLAEPSSKEQALTALRAAAFDVKMRGYNRKQVENYLDEARAQLS